ncbi:MAG: DUF134 domain-containing protein [Spirochaetia bacterium]
MQNIEDRNQQAHPQGERRGRRGAPKKERRCRGIGRLKRYKPAGIPGEDLPVCIIYRDEFEAVRLCDLEGCSQSEAGDAMGISRGTVQRLLKSGRAKISGAILRGEVLAFDEDKEAEYE